MQCLCFNTKIMTNFSTWNIYGLFPASFNGCTNDTLAENKINKINKTADFLFYCNPLVHIPYLLIGI